MAANIGQALGAIVKNNTSGAVRREARLPDPPALYPGGSDLGKALGGAVGNAGASAFGERVVGYAPQGSSIPPPPTLSLAEALAVKAAQFMVPEPAASRGGWNMDRIDDVRQLPPIPVSERARREQQRDDALPVTRIPRETATEEWGVYDVNGSMVAMPSVLADRNKLTTPIGVREPTSDPKLVANLKSSAYNYEKMQPAALAGLDLELPRIKRTPMMDAGDALGKNMREGVISTQGLAAPDTGDGEFMLLKHKEDGSVILRPRKSGEEALAGGMYNLVTGNVSREQVPGIMALPGMSDTGAIRDNAEVRDSTQTEAAVAARDYDHALANQRLREVASRADVVEIDGKAYPRGTTEPVPVLRTTGYDLYGKSGTTTDDIPVPPDGWAWVSDGKEAWLVQEQYDNRGVLITPRGTERIESRAEKRDTLLTNIEDMATDTFVTVLEKSINGAMKVSSAIVPQKLKSAWDTYIQEPMTIILMAKMPEGRLRNMLLTAIENPIAGALLFVNWGGDKNVDLITDSILYPGESRLADAARWQRHAPWVREYADFIEANEDEARRIYEHGWDADGDDIPDVTGGEAVAQWWHDTELVNAPGGSATWLMFLMLTDPLTWAAGVGGIGKGATSTLRAARLNATTPRAARLLHLAERGTGALTKTARIAEDIGDLGLRPLLEGIGKASSKGIPLPGGRRTRPLNPLVSSARKGEHVADAQSAIGNLMRQEGSAGGNTVGGLGTLEVDAQGNVVLRLHERNMTAAERRTGEKPAAVDQAEIERIYDEAVGLQPGESIPTGRNSRAVKTEDGWRVETSDGQVVESQTLAGALGQEEQSLGRWFQRPLPPPGSDLKPRYIDMMNKERLYRPVRDVLGGEWGESIRVQRLSDTPGTDVPNTSHLNESDRMAWRTMEVTNSIDPTYTKSWERNIQGGDTLYQLSEIFRRTDYANAMRYWEAMTGKAASPVPLHFGQGFMSKRPIVSLGKVASNVTDANSRSVMRANRALDNVYARLRWHPEDIYKPEFATIVEQAAKLDVNLRERGLRSSGPGWAFDPITTLIPDDAPVKLSRKVRASGAYRAPEFSQVHDAGDFVGRTTLDPELDIHVDVHEIALQSVPEEWQASWIGNLPDGRDWMDSWYRADVNRAGVTELSTYGPTSELARKVAIDTATARDLVDADTVRVVAGVADITPVDYV
ncbi:hypothetical protein, partial [Methylobacillus sp.]|uniref:hypothetical protein n=1 Tax=Methylobacillus sp. TaxID=56818 RepID=UPI002FE298A2